MAVISGDRYNDLATDYAYAWATTTGAKTYLYDAVYQVVILQTILPEVDLLNAFWDTYNANAASSSPTTPFIPAVAALQKHVLQRGGYTNVDQYIYAEIYVPSGGTTLLPLEWKTLSDAAGYTISSMYVTTVPII